MKKYILSHVGTLLVACALVGCKAKTPPESILAHVGKDIVTVDELTAYEARQKPLPNKPQTPDAVLARRRQLLNLLIDQKIIAAEARRRGLDRDKNYMLHVAFLKESLLQKPLADHLGPITEAQSRDYYDQYKQNFGPQIQFLRSRIVVHTPKEAKQAQDLLARGMSFAEVAKRLSKDLETAAQGGRLPLLQEGAIDPDLATLLKSLSIGQVSPLRKIPQGYELIRKDDEIRTPALPYEQVVEQIRKTLEREKVHLWAQSVRPSLNITVNEQAMNSLALSSPTPQN